MGPSTTPGGKRLRLLRKYHGKTQLDVELDASLGIGYLQRLERGKVRQPERETLERILLALNAHYTERREVLELFGYLVDAPIPNAQEVEWAITVCQTELDRAVFPAYLLDCSHRLLYWNKLVPQVFDTGRETPASGETNDVSMLRMVFDSAYQMTQRIKNAAIFFPAQIRALRYEMQRFHDEAWYGLVLDNMLTCDAFAAHWHQEQQQTVHIPARPLTPIELRVGKNILKFRLISEPYVQDHRFRVLFYLPADTNTTYQCMNWATGDAIPT